MVSRSLRFAGAVAFAAVWSSAPAWANGSSFHADAPPKKSYAQVDPIATQGGAGSTYRGPRSTAADVAAGCDPRIFISREVEIEDMPEIVSIAYFKKMAEEAGIPYQTLINLYLRDCAAAQRRLAMKWSA